MDFLLQWMEIFRPKVLCLHVDHNSILARSGLMVHENWPAILSYFDEVQEKLEQVISLGAFECFHVDASRPPAEVLSKTTEWLSK